MTPAMSFNEGWNLGNEDIELVTLKGIYKRTAFWRTNLFRVQTKSVGKQFVAELTNLIDAWNNSS